ncbi:MAG: EAL domain-containing protein [Betaproteobacteria bacterium]|nr:EAL domain-containing protein [Betaproteobacteria bacterium]
MTEPSINPHSHGKAGTASPPSVELLDAFLDAIAQPMAAFTAEGVVMSCNATCRDEFARLYGRPLEPLSRLDEYLAELPQEWDRLHGLIRRAAGGESFTVEAELGDASLARSLYSMMFAPLRDRDGTIAGAALIAQDITETKRAHTLLLESERRFRDLAANVPGVIYQWVERADGSRGFLWVSPRLEEIFHIDRNAISSIADYIHPDDRPRWVASIEQANRRSSVWNFEGRLLYPDGTVRWWQGIARPSRVTAEEIVYNGVMLDITDRKLAEQELMLAAKVFEGTREAVMILDDSGAVLSANRAFTAITGFRADEVKGTPLPVFDGARHDQAFVESLWEHAHRDAGWEGEVWLRRRDELVFPARLRANVVRAVDGTPTHCLLAFEDISERKAQDDRIRHLAQHDFLTGLPNRALLEDRLKQAIPLAQRSGNRLAVMFLDLDRFKIINDSLGHEVGDALLKQVARRLTGCIRAADTVSRQGGDEFVVLLQDLDAPEQAAAVCRKVLEVVAEPFVFQGLALNVTPSVGIAIYPDDGADFPTLLKNADAAMYHAKSLGRNNFQFFTQEINARVLERAEIESRLRGALHGGELQLWFQPRFDLATRAVAGLEALLRWPDGGGGFTPPERFIPVAEDSGLIVELGNWCIRRVCRHLKEWTLQEVPLVPVSTNISAVQFRQGGVAAGVMSALEELGVNSRLLELEVTESAIMSDAETARTTLSELRKRGVRLAVDDFGTGYSSLAYLRRLPLDTLKIDRTFVQGIDEDPEDAAIAVAIIGLAKTLGLRTLAEGIETQEQLEFLRRHGCDEGQGFLLARPMPPDMVPTWLHSVRGPAQLSLGM